MQKIKVNLDEKNYNTLLSDMKLFLIKKNDKSINKNKFINLLFSNFYEEYLCKIKKIENVASSIMKKLNLNNELAFEFSVLYNNKITEDSDKYYTSSITFVLSNENDYIFESMLDNLRYQTASQYFRDLINEYLTYPQYKREQIIFKDNVDKINDAIKKSKKIKLHLNKEIVTFNPYKLDTSKEELYTYLIGTSNEKIQTINISKINKVIETHEVFKFTNEEATLMNEIIENGIQFPYQKPCVAAIKLNDVGKRMYERRYLHRPMVKKIEGDVYYFSCSFEQLLFYFMAFGKNAIVLEPQSLQNNIKYEHLNAFKLYK